MNGKYGNPYYWQHIIRQHRLSAEFNEMPITAQSSFFYGILYNSYGRRKLAEDVLHFSDLDALIGYLYYIFFPMAFLSFTNQEYGIAVPLDISLEEIISYAARNEFVEYHQYQQTMYEIFLMMQMALEDSSSEGLKGTMIKRSQIAFNQAFQKDNDAYGRYFVFHSPEALGQHFAELYQIDGDKILGERIFYSLTGIHKDEWLPLCKEVNSNLFAARKFMNAIQSLKHSKANEKIRE